MGKFLALIIVACTALPALADLPALNIQTLEDSHRSISIQSLLSQPEQFTWQQGNSNLQFGYTQSRHWIRFELPSHLMEGHRLYVIKIPYTYFDQIQFYEIQNGKIVHKDQQGLAVIAAPQTLRPRVTGAYTFSLPRQDHYHNTMIYLAVEGDFPLSVPLEISTKGEVMNVQMFRSLFLGAFIGALLLAFAYNAFLAFAVRSRSYLYYCLFVLSALFLFLGHERISSQYLWPNLPWWTLRELHVFGGLSFLFYVFFVRDFLQTRLRTPRLDRIVLALVGISTFRALYIFITPNQTISILGQLAIFISNFLILAIAAICLFKQVRSAKYFLISSFIFNFGYILFMLHTADIVRFGTWVEFAPHIGILTEVLLLSFALGDRIRETKQQLQQRNLEIIQTEKMAALGRMGASISHEINNPLTIISANANSIEHFTNQAHPNIEKIRHASLAIDRNVKRISRIIRSMRIVARDSTKDPISQHRLSEILNDVETLSQERFKDENVQLKITPADPNLIVNCRSPEVCQVLINLLNNAFDAVQDQPRREVKVDWALKDQQICISVTDSGPGVPEQIREHIYEPFFTSKPVGKGTGLGLSISRSLIENQGGQLWLDSESERTKFVFSLPVSKDQNPSKNNN